jgi:hypothetical protein
VEGAVTHSGGSRHLTFQVTFHLAFTIYYLPFTIYHLPFNYLPSTIYGHRHRYRLRLFIIAQSYKKSTNYARKILTNHDESRHITPKKDKSRHITPKRANGSPVLRTFATC